MNNQILNRDSFVNEVYSKKNTDEINEGIFDFFKTVLKQEWSSVKSKNGEIKKRLEDCDRSLKGFTIVKMKKAGQCAEIRQALCDLANTLYDTKTKELEDGKKLQKMLMGLKDKDKISDEDKETVKTSGEVSSYMKKYNVKDKALADKITTYAKKINTLCKGDPDITRWADLLKDEVRNVVNDMIIAEYDKIAEDEDKEKVKKYKEEVEKQRKEEEADRKKKDEEAQKTQEEKIKKIEKERADVLSKVGVSILKNQTGDKAYDTLSKAYTDMCDDILNALHKNGGNTNDEDEDAEGLNDSKKYSFANFINEELEKDVMTVLGSDVYFGFDKVKDEQDLDKDKLLIILKEIRTIFKAVEQLTQSGKTLAETPSDAIQAMYVGLSQLITCAILDRDLDGDMKTLLARCAIDSDKTLGYGLPPVDEKKPESGNIFVAITQQLMDSKDEAGVFKDNKELLNKLKQNMSKMFNEISKHAEELKDAKEKEDEKEVKKVEQEDNKD